MTVPDVSTEAAGARKAPLYPWLVLGVLMLVYTCGYVDRFALTIMLDAVKASLGATDTYMGFLAGPAFAVFFTLASLPMARLADRHSRVLILALGCATWSAFTLLSGFAETKTGFTIARLGVGLGEATCLAPAYSLLADYFPKGQRALPIGFFNLSVYIGQIGGLWFGGAMSASLGWRRTYLLIGAPGLAIALLFWLIVREPVRGRLDGAGGTAAMPPSAAVNVSSPETTLAATAGWLFRMPVFRFMVAGAALATFAGMSFVYWAPAFFARVHHLPKADIGRNFGLIYGLASMVGALLGGRLGNAWARRRDRGSLHLAAVGVLLTTLFAAAICLAPGANLAYWLLVPAGIATGSWLVPVQATIQDLVGSHSRATAAAVFSCCALIIGFLGPWAVGFLSDRWAPSFGDQTLRYAILAVVTAGLGGSLAFYRGARIQVRVDGRGT